MTLLRRVLIMAGGTGGHVFPGLALAEHLRSKGIEVYWLGTREGLESRIVPAAGFTLYYISVGGLRGKGLRTLLSAPFRLTVAIIQSVQHIYKLKPDVILGMGGFVSGPGGIASLLLRYPLVIHEQNTKPGFTNRILASVAKKVLEAFPYTFSLKKKVVTTGNPVRVDLLALPLPEKRLLQTDGRIRVLVIGGSLGAQVLNQIVPKALALLPLLERPVVYHQTGEKHFTLTQQAYQSSNVAAEIVPFIHQMDKAYAWADVVLSRSGALTISELCAVGLGAILIPYPYAVDDHQTTNALFMVKHKAAILVPQAEATAESLSILLKELISAPQKLLMMAQAAYCLRQENVVQNISNILEEVYH